MGFIGVDVLYAVRDVILVQCPCPIKETWSCSDLGVCATARTYVYVYIHTRVNQKVKTIFKLRGNRYREELPN